MLFDLFDSHVSSRKLSLFFLTQLLILSRSSSAGGVAWITAPQIFLSCERISQCCRVQKMFIELYDLANSHFPNWFFFSELKSLSCVRKSAQKRARSFKCVGSYCYLSEPINLHTRRFYPLSGKPHLRLAAAFCLLKLKSSFKIKIPTHLIFFACISYEMYPNLRISIIISSRISRMWELSAAAIRNNHAKIRKEFLENFTDFLPTR